MADWLWGCLFLAYTVLFFISGHLRYKHGVWDGAFNQFLPHVQKAMREYDERRADEILEQKEPRP